MKIPKKYHKTLELYRLFSDDIVNNLIDDDLAKEQMFVWESYGMKKYKDIFNQDMIPNDNGYYHGKRWLDLQITMWKEDIKDRLFFIEELNDDFRLLI